MKNCFIIAFLFFIQRMYAQDASFYCHIDDPDYVPVETKTKSISELEVKTKKAEFNQVLQKRKIKSFKQAFPTADTKWLRNVYYIKSDDRTLSEEIKEKFKDKISNVESLCEPILCYTPNDYGKAVGQLNLDLVKAKDAWDIVRDFPKIPVGVSDTHFENTQEDLDGQFIEISGSNSPNVSDAFHGTAVAGCLSAITDNNIGISAIGFNTKLYATTNWADDNEVLLLAQKGVRVINCSWINSFSYNVTQDSLYSRIKNRYNTVVVFGAGNHVYNTDLFEKVYPASYESVISVTAVGHEHPRGYVDPIYGNLFWIDCHEAIVGDPTSAYHHNDAVDICAPGYNVPSINDATLNLPDKYGTFYGTSFAAPQVAATVGLILSINPCLTASQAIDVLLNSADRVIYSIPENAPYIGLLGKGRLDAYAAVLQAAETATIRYSTPINFSGTQSIYSNYAIRTNSTVTILTGSKIDFITRKEVELGPGFEVQSNAEFNINVNLANPVVCQ